MRQLIIMTVILMTLGCQGQTNMKTESPLIAVIKLQAAESVMNLDEAEKYIDIRKVFGKYPDSTNPRKEWKEMLMFFYNIGKSKKFTNTFKYYNYNISERATKIEAKVNFTAINNDAKIKKIVYSLITVNNKWKVVKIDYKN